MEAEGEATQEAAEPARMGVPLADGLPQAVVAVVADREAVGQAGTEQAEVLAADQAGVETGARVEVDSGGAVPLDLLEVDRAAAVVLELAGRELAGVVVGAPAAAEQAEVRAADSADPVERESEEEAGALAGDQALEADLEVEVAVAEDRPAPEEALARPAARRCDRVCGPRRLRQDSPST